MIFCVDYKSLNSIFLRTKVCTRYCGGSHTKMNNVDLMQAAIVVNSLKRETKLMTGTDGKVNYIFNFVSLKGI